MAGPALKPIGMGQVKQFRAQLPERIQIVGVGGIRSGQDVLDYLRAGADAVAIATSLVEEGPAVFSRILSEYVDLVESGEN
jgi:dihydroorotate dehydrogenase (fumarate)